MYAGENPSWFVKALGAFDSPWWVIGAMGVAVLLRVWVSDPPRLRTAWLRVVQGALAALTLAAVAFALRSAPDQPTNKLAIAGIVAAFGALLALTADQAYAQKHRATLLELMDSGLIALLLVFCIARPFVIQAFYIPSGSMEPTLLVNDRILVNKFVYFFEEPKAGDIVVFRAPPRAFPDFAEAQQYGKMKKVEKKDFIKRVVGAPGDRLRVHDGKLYRNGQPVDEPWLVDVRDGRMYHDGSLVGALPGALNNPRSFDVFVGNVPDYEWPDPMNPEAEFTVPAETLMVFGDNRNHSNDSHVWGPLPRENVLGRAMVIFWPLPRLRLLR